MKLPGQYAWLEREEGPRILREFLALYGVMETPGPQNSPTIMRWAAELEGFVGMAYTADSIPWCGIGMGVAALRADFAPPKICARASSWDTWGTGIAKDKAALGDVLRFERPGGGHVGLYVGEDTAGFFHVLGANQSDSVNITRISKDRCVTVRRCPWRTAQPANVRKIILAPAGNVSKNEA